jgi:hypothetical protein
MTKSDWEKAPKWKKESLKKQEGIYWDNHTSALV